MKGNSKRCRWNPPKSDSSKGIVTTVYTSFRKYLSMCLFVFVICMYICIWYLFGFLTLCIFLCNTVDCKRGLFDEKSSLVENGRGRGYRGSPVLTLMPELYWTSCPVQKSSKSGLSGNQKFSIPDAGLQNRRKNQKKSFRFFFSRFFFFFFFFKYIKWIN